MKRIILIATAFLLLVFAVSAMATEAEIDALLELGRQHDSELAKHDSEIKSLLELANLHDTELAKYNSEIQALYELAKLHDIELGKRPPVSPRPNAGRKGGTTVVTGASGVVNAQKTANRALAWAVRLSFIVEQTGKYPDIEDVERMLSPLVEGDLKPAAFEKAVWAEAAKLGWKYLEAPAVGADAGLEERIVARLKVMIEQIIDEKIAAVRQEFQSQIDQLKADVQVAKDAATRAEGSAANAATSASNAVQSAADAALSAKTAAENMSSALVDASATAYVKIDTYNTDRRTDDVRFKKLEERDDCIEKKVDEIGAEVKTNTEVIGYILTSVGFHLNGKDLEADASIYLAILKDYEGNHLAAAARLKQLLWHDKKVAKARFYAADELYIHILGEYSGDHAKARMNLRSWGLSEEEIKTICKSNGAPYQNVK